MADIFISYAREDVAVADALARVLEQHGWSVWWDRRVHVGQSFDREIEQAIDDARCVVVLWSRHSVSSAWVRNEAGAGAERGILAPALLEEVKLPLEFRRIQAASLMNWNGDPAHPGCQALFAAIQALVDMDRGSNDATRTAAPSNMARSDRGARGIGAVLAGLTAALVVVIASVYVSQQRPDARPKVDAAKPVQAVVSGTWLIEEGPKTFRTVIRLNQIDDTIVGETEVDYPPHLVMDNWLRRQSSIYDGRVKGDRVSFKTKRSMLTLAGHPETRVDVIDQYEGRITGDRISFFVSRVGGETWEADARRN